MNHPNRRADDHRPTLPLRWGERFTLLLTGPNAGVVGAYGATWPGQPADYERVNVCVEGTQKLDDIEQYRLQMAGISTAALGYWKEGDTIHPDYDTPALRDVARLYAKYDELFKFREQVRQMASMLRAHEWAEDLTATGDAADLQSVITELVPQAWTKERVEELAKSIAQEVADNCSTVPQLTFPHIYLGLLEALVPARATPAKQAASFPARDPEKSAEQQGLFHKFDVRRVDGSDQLGGKHHGCRYYVMDLTHDQNAPAAMRAYAAACETTHPQLAADIRAEFPAVEFKLMPVAKVRVFGESVTFQDAQLDVLRTLDGAELYAGFSASQTKPAIMSKPDAVSAAVKPAMPGDWSVTWDAYSPPETIMLSSPKWGGCFLRPPEPHDIGLHALAYRLFSDFLGQAAAVAQPDAVEAAMADAVMHGTGAFRMNGDGSTERVDWQRDALHPAYSVPRGVELSAEDRRYYAGLAAFAPPQRALHDHLYGEFRMVENLAIPPGTAVLVAGDKLENRGVITGLGQPADEGGKPE